MMTVDQVVQYSYMAPNALKSLNSSDLKDLANKTRNELIKLNRSCPQSQKKDRALYQYKHALRIVEKLINQSLNKDFRKSQRKP